jgi:hypothetical protein
MSAEEREVFVDSEDGEWPAPFEAAVDLDEDRTDDLDGPTEVILGDRSAPVDDATQGRRDRLAGVRDRLAETGNHPRDEERGGRAVAEGGLGDESGVEAAKDHLGEAHVQKRKCPHHPGAVHQLLGGQEAFVVAEAGAVGARAIEGAVDLHAGGPVGVGHGHGQEVGFCDHAGIEEMGRFWLDGRRCERPGKRQRLVLVVDQRPRRGALRVGAVDQDTVDLGGSEDGGSFRRWGARVDRNPGASSPFHCEMGLHRDCRIPEP